MKRLLIILLINLISIGIFNIYAENKHLIFETGKDGKEYWYENGVKQGVYGQKGNVWYDNTERGREIYDPTSDGWYWLDCVYSGAKAVNKEVFMPYVYQDEDSWIDNLSYVYTYAMYSKITSSKEYANYTGAQFRDDCNASMEVQVYDAIINKTGKWVRYDSEGKMIKGWYTVEEKDRQYYPDQVGNTYYYDYQTGLMAKGWTVVGGYLYHFDEVTGALIRPLEYSTEEPPSFEHEHNMMHQNTIMIPEKLMYPTIDYVYHPEEDILQLEVIEVNEYVLESKSSKVCSCGGYLTEP